MSVLSGTALPTSMHTDLSTCTGESLFAFVVDRNLEREMPEK